MADITNIRKILFGVNYLGADGADTVRAIWKSRFTQREAYLLEADPATNPKEIFDGFREMLKDNKQTHLTGRECLLVFFVDGTAELTAAAEAAIWNMKKAFEQVLGCNVQAVLQFAYVGRRGDGETKVQRENVKKALARNNEKAVYENYRLFLIGKASLDEGEDHSWKAALVYLDLLRRSEALVNSLPMAGDLGQDNVGFLRYSEYDHIHYQEMQQRQRRLTALLADADSSKLRTLIDAERKAIVTELEQRYNIQGEVHPQHPDMIVPKKKGFFGPDPQDSARRGKNPAYNNAVKYTKNAVESTGIRMGKEIAERFKDLCDQAEQRLEELFRDANVGIKLKLNPVEMNSALYLQGYPAPGTMPKLEFKYSEQGVQGEIDEYLEYIKKTGIAKGLLDYSKALQTAFENISQEEFRREKNKLEKELAELNHELTSVLDARSFCEEVAQNNPHESTFDTTNDMVVDNVKYLLCRNEMLSEASTAGNLGLITVHSVDEQMCGMVEFDNAPLKALMIECVVCKDWVLDHLIPEVNWFAF